MNDLILDDTSSLIVRYPQKPRYSFDELEVILRVKKRKYCIFQDSFYYVFQREIPALLTYIQKNPSIRTDEIRVLLDGRADNVYQFTLFENRDLTTTLVNSSAYNLLRVDLWRSNRNPANWKYTLLHSFHVDRTSFFSWLANIMRNADIFFGKRNV